MDTISRGQITVVDLNDGKAMNMYLNSSRPTTQIYNNDTKSYVPSWAASPYLVITPELSVTGATTNQMSRLKTAPTWKINGSTTLANFGATVATTAPYAITVKNNLNAAQWTFECSGIYVDPDNGAETAVKASITFSKADTAGAPIRAIGYAPDGTIFQNNKVATLKAHCDL